MLYSVLLEASPLPGSLAKRVSRLPLGLGLLWAAFSKTKQAWRDSLAKTVVIPRQ